MDQPLIFSSWLPFAGLDKAWEDQAAKTEGLEEPTLGASSLADLCCSRTSICWGRSPMNILEDSLYSSLVDLCLRTINLNSSFKKMYSLFLELLELDVCAKEVLSTGDTLKNVNVTLSLSSNKLQSSR